MSEHNDVTLRPVTEADRELLVKIYEASREIELSLTDWDVEQRRRFAELQLDGQTMHYRELYPHAIHNIIFSGDEAAGRLYVNRSPEQIAILDITVLPDYRRKGIATSLVKSLQDEAAAGQSVRVYVETFNPSSMLFAGLGFVPVGEEGVNVRYEWRRE